MNFAGSVPKPSKQIAVRCTLEEATAIRQAAAAFAPMMLSNLLEVATTQCVLDHSMILGVDVPPRIKPSYVWPFAPLRPEGQSTSTRLTPYFPAHLHVSVSAFAAAIRLSVPMTIIGASYSPTIAALVVPYGVDSLVRAAPRHWRGLP